MTAAPSDAKPNPNVVFTQLDDTQAALLNLETKQYFSLNETGCHIWRLLEGGQTPAAIAEDLVAHYTLELDAAHTKVAEFLGELARAKLVELA